MHLLTELRKRGWGDRRLYKLRHLWSHRNEPCLMPIKSFECLQSIPNLLEVCISNILVLLCLWRYCQWKRWSFWAKNLGSTNCFVFVKFIDNQQEPCVIHLSRPWKISYNHLKWLNFLHHQWHHELEIIKWKKKRQGCKQWVKTNRKCHFLTLI